LCENLSILGNVLTDCILCENNLHFVNSLFTKTDVVLIVFREKVWTRLRQGS